MGRKSFEKAGGLSPERIRQMDADIAQALSSERETGGVDVPSLKLLDAIDAKIRRRNRRSVAGAFAAVCLPLVALCLTAFAELYGWGHEPVMRSVQVPAGEHLRVLLADGSAVTLNACSELRYPERFARRRREVRLVRGEAFFEVAHDASAPFTVETDDVSVEVLGTKFNVNAYDKEVTTVYLKEGKVRLTERVTGRQNRYLMAPDEMLAVDRNARTCRAVRPAAPPARAGPGGRPGSRLPKHGCTTTMPSRTRRWRMSWSSSNGIMPSRSRWPTRAFSNTATRWSSTTRRSTRCFR